MRRARDGDHGTDNGLPQTGTNAELGLALLAFGSVTAGVIVLLIARRRRD